MLRAPICRKIFAGQSVLEVAASLIAIIGILPGMGNTAEPKNESPGDSSIPEQTVENLIDTEPVSDGELRTLNDRREAAHERFLALFDEGIHAEAVTAGLLVVELTQEQFGQNDIRLVSPLDNLATAQMMNGDLVAAESNYRISIGLLEKHEGILSTRLINPLIGLGATYNRSALYDDAIKSFERALHINHVNDGFYNIQQFKIRDGLTESHIGLEDLEDANFQQESQVDISKRKLGLESPEVVPAMHKLARWYERSGQAEAARFTYQSAQKLLREAHGKNDPSLVSTLLGIAGTYEQQGLIAEGASYLKKALQILDDQQPTDHLQRAEVLVELGDLYSRSSKFESAQEQYAKAWQDLSADEVYFEQREKYFSSPVRIQGLPWKMLRYPPGEKGDAALADYASGYVLLKYSIDTRGRIREAEIIEAVPNDIIEERVLTVLQRSYFRPRYTEGEPVQTEDLIYRHEFQYQPGEYDNRDDRSDDSDEESDKKNSGRLEFPDSNE